MSVKEKIPIVSLHAIEPAGRWQVKRGGVPIGEVQEDAMGRSQEYSRSARIVGSEHYAFPTLWAAAYALAYGWEVARLRESDELTIAYMLGMEHGKDVAK